MRILLVTRNNVSKIGDWGLARSLPESRDQKLITPVVTLWYRSPGLIAGSKYYGREVVIWSVGCIFCELITKAATFRADFEAQQLELIIQLCGRPTGELLDYYKALPD